MKKNIIYFVSGALIFGAVGVFAGQYTAYENPFTVKLNGSEVELNGYNIEGSTYFKLRDIAAVVGGFDVDFKDNTILLSNDGTVYYTSCQWLPDYGACTGDIMTDWIEANDMSLKYQRSFLELHYPRTDGAVKKYTDLLTKVGFEYSEIQNDVTDGYGNVRIAKGTPVLRKGENFVTITEYSDSVVISTYPGLSPTMAFE